MKFPWTKNSADAVKLIVGALDFAAVAHAGQIRKYTREAYIYHPIGVAKILSGVTQDPEIIAGGLLHDVIEESNADREHLRLLFGERVANLVVEVSAVSKPEDGNRERRKLIDRQHYAQASPGGQTIKLADMIHNSVTLPSLDPSFARTYMPEQRELVKVLTKGHLRLQTRATEIIDEYFEKNAEVFKLRKMVDATRPRDARNN